MLPDMHHFAPRIAILDEQVREDLDGCVEGEVSVYDVWLHALTALKFLRAPIDDACLERLFWRENRMVSNRSLPPAILACAYILPQPMTLHQGSMVKLGMSEAQASYPKVFCRSCSTWRLTMKTF